MLLYFSYTFEELEKKSSRGFTKPYRVRGSLTNHYPMSDRRRNYYYFVPFYDADKISKFQIYIHGTPIYSIDPDNIITWNLDDKSWDSGITRILNNNMHEERGLIRYESSRGGLCFVIYKQEDNPKYKDYMGNILDKYAAEVIWKTKEVFPLKPNMQYKLVKFTPEGANCYHEDDTLESISKYDVVARKLDGKKAREAREEKKFQNEEIEFSSVFSLLDDWESEVSLYNSLIDNVLGKQEDRSLYMFGTSIGRQQEFIRKASEHSVINKIFIQSFFKNPLTNRGAESVARWSGLKQYIWDAYLLSIYAEKDCYHKKYYSCDDKYFPTNKEILIQMRGE